MQTIVTEGQSNVKKRGKRGPRGRNYSILQSHALDNAQERLAAFYDRNAAVIDEYIKLQWEVNAIRISLGLIQQDLKKLCVALATAQEEK